ncbi:TOPRIM nucleotidyl transferase/hydrolase domain-containing protein [Mumia sp. ZJ430]|uniref:TOPRIM nucleotidyl transferase/hydrolase domain-containing protein n=1 Tax=Mumia sp. ZJ430 TaxID=2708083 RepID=UPI0014244BEC|nr:TOPRIM nucleotidyl transferase/hydrolase domain-containing protein [Mumia sp. ZJ430]
MDSTALVHLRPATKSARGNSAVSFAEFGDDGENDPMHDLATSLSNHELLHARVVVVAEGDTEQVVIPLLYRRIHGRSAAIDRVHVISRRGGSEAVRMADMLAHQLHRETVLTLDADQAETKDVRAALKLVGDVEKHFLGVRELEDCFDDTAWSAGIIAYAEKHQLPSDHWHPDRIGKIRTEAALRGKGLSKALNDVLYPEWDHSPRKQELARLVAERAELSSLHDTLIRLMHAIKRP